MDDILRKTAIESERIRRTMLLDERIRKATMIDNTMRGALARHAEITRVVGNIAPKVGALAHLQDASAIQRISEMTKRVDLVGGAIGSLSNVNAVYGGVGSLAEVTRIHDQIRTFALPAIEAAMQLSAQADASGIYSAMRQLQDQTAGIRSAMESMHAPWLDVQNQLRSMGGFAELQRIGLCLKSIPTYDIELTESLRINLGDWRDTISWPQNIFSDEVARTEFYEQRGLNLELTDFPAEAFDESTAIAGLAVNPPPLIHGYISTIDAEEVDEEAEFKRTNAAHDRLQRFESQLRHFINERMTAAYGPDWIKHYVPGEIRERWVEKKKKAEHSGEKDWPLIAYADFTDYVPIIIRSDNWASVFKPVFGRAESVRESFQRLYPIRLCTMHARLITQDDELYLLVETKRILRAIN